MGLIEEPSDEQLKAIEQGQEVPIKGSKDGQFGVPGDHDQPYRFGRKPRAIAPFPFTPREFTRLLTLRGRLWEKTEASGEHPNLFRFVPPVAPTVDKRRKKR